MLAAAADGVPRVPTLLSARFCCEYAALAPPQVLAAVADGVQRDMGELLAAVMAPASGLHAFDFLGGSLMPEVEAAISKAMPGKTGPALPTPATACMNDHSLHVCDVIQTYDITGLQGIPQSHTTCNCNPMCATVQAGP